MRGRGQAGPLTPLCPPATRCPLYITGTTAAVHHLRRNDHTDTAGPVPRPSVADSGFVRGWDRQMPYHDDDDTPPTGSQPRASTWPPGCGLSRGERLRGLLPCCQLAAAPGPLTRSAVSGSSQATWPQFCGSFGHGHAPRAEQQQALAWTSCNCMHLAPVHTILRPQATNQWPIRHTATHWDEQGWASCQSQVHIYTTFNYHASAHILAHIPHHGICNPAFLHHVAQNCLTAP